MALDSASKTSGLVRQFFSVSFWMSILKDVVRELLFFMVSAKEDEGTMGFPSQDENMGMA